MTSIVEAIDMDLKELTLISQDTYTRKGIISPDEFHEINNSLRNTTDYMEFWDIEMGTLNLNFNEVKMDTIAKS